MKVAGIQQIRSDTAAFLGSQDPVLVTRRGRVSGLYLPLEKPGGIPDDLAREVSRSLGAYLSRLLEAKGVSEEEVQSDFDAFRRRRR